ncbi:MAG TPA: hypothetical protein VJU79_00950, partial [Candidatus Dormibacteraeota bacterium]|nr:hypothetical protein [Candidatus Dormibacteraeota bacterium]
GLLALLGAEIAGFSGALYIGINEGFYGGITPSAALPDGASPTGVTALADYAHRASRVGGLLVDRDVGLLRWAPILALAFVGVWLLWRGHRERLTQAVPGYRTMAAAAGLCTWAFAAQFFVATFLAPHASGQWFPGRQLIAVLPLTIPLVGWGMRHLPRLGAVLALITAAASIWLYVDVRWGGGGLAVDRPDAPWGPLVKAFPRFDGSAYPTALTVAACLAVVLLVWRKSRQWRQLGASTT